MKRQLLFVQGAGEGTHEEWDRKLVESLLVVEELLTVLGDGVIVVGHPVGGTINACRAATTSSTTI